MLGMRPDVVVCTHAFPCGAMAEYKSLFPDAPPVVAIVTDFAVHGFWIHERVDRYVVATEAMRDAVMARGIAKDAISVSGIPVRREFAQFGESRTALRERLNLPADRRVVLLMGGGLGTAPIEAMISALQPMREPFAAVVLAGRNTRAARRLSEAAERLDFPVRALGFVDNVYDYMHAADVLVTKPGGLTTSEALVAQLPMVLCRPLPGQEERNARVLVESGAAIRARNIEELPGLVEMLLRDRTRRERAIAGARRIGRPNAAAEAASMIAGMVDLRKEVVA
jgi:processive 1,2-diacylglycerol beta-glucosyltransferase